LLGTFASRPNGRFWKQDLWFSLRGRVRGIPSKCAALWKCIGGLRLPLITQRDRSLDFNAQLTGRNPCVFSMFFLVWGHLFWRVKRYFGSRSTTAHPTRRQGLHSALSDLKQANGLALHHIRCFQRMAFRALFLLERTTFRDFSCQIVFILASALII